METTSNQDPTETPNDGASNSNEGTSKNTTAGSAEAKQQDDESSTGEAKPYIPKPGEDIELRKKFN